MAKELTDEELREFQAVCQKAQKAFVGFVSASSPRRRRAFDKLKDAVKDAADFADDVALEE